MKMIYNIVKLNFDICSLEWKLLEKLNVKTKFPEILIGLIRALYFSFLSLKYVNIFLPKNKILFLVGSHNQLTTLNKISSKVEDSYLLSYHRFESSKCFQHIPLFWFYICGWACLPITLYSIFKVKHSYQKWALKIRFERALISGPSVFVWSMLFKIWKPKAIVVSNDHIHWTRSAIKAAKDLGINTIYIPHASTSSSFPELECTYSFLDSKIQKSMYRNNQSTIVISGAVRFEDKVLQVTECTPSGILVCFNDQDTTSLIEWVLDKLINECSHSVYIKPHPSDTVRHAYFKRLALKYNVTYVEPLSDIASVSKLVQILLAGVTGAHVDALMYSIFPLTLNTWYQDDYYGLIKEEVLTVVDDFSGLDIIYRNNFQRVMELRNNHNQHCSDLNSIPSNIVCDLLNTL